MDSQLHAAIRKSKTSALRELLMRPEVISRLDNPSQAFLYAAVVRDNYEATEMLLQAGASPNVPNPGLDRFTPLQRAIYNDTPQLVEILLRYGADTDAMNVAGITALYVCRNRAQVERLIEAGANPCLPGARGPLLWCSTTGNIEVVNALIAAGVDPSSGRPRGGWTPLHAAASNGRLEVIEALLAAGANALASAGKRKRKTPLRYVHSGTPQKRQTIISALVAAGDRNWAYVPTPCAGLRRALKPTWEAAYEELPELFKRLEPEVQARVQAALAGLHCSKLHEELRLRVITEAFS